MIYLLVGENSFTRQRALAAILAEFDGDIQTLEGSEVTLRDLPDLFQSATLFGDRRLVVIKDLSEHSSIWNELPDWLERIADDTTVVFVETKPDRRTAAFKALKKEGIIKEFPNWNDRDQSTAEQWLVDEAATLGLMLDKKCAHRIVERVGLDQHRLVSAIEKLLIADQPVTIDLIDLLIDADPSANAFLLFELALSGHQAAIVSQIEQLRAVEDPYRVFGLLTSQVFQLSAVYVTDSQQASREFGVHPYVAKKLHASAGRLTKAKLRTIIDAFHQSDIDMKTTSTDPWLLVERALLATTQ